MAVDIMINVDRDFELWLNHLRTKYGEEFEYLNGLHSSQMDTTKFIDNFIDKNVADSTIDSNANAHSKDICSLLAEQDKSLMKLLSFNKIFYEMKKKYGLKTAREWLELEWSNGFYMHDAPSSSMKSYCLSPSTRVITNMGNLTLEELNGKQFKIININGVWEDATCEYFGKSKLKKITLRRNGVEKVVEATDNHRWFVYGTDKKIMILTSNHLLPGMELPYVEANMGARDSRNEYPWVITSVIQENELVDTYCVVNPSTHSFTLTDGLLTHNCYNYSLKKLAEEGLFFISEYNNEAPKHLTTFLDDLIEMVSFGSNRTSGAFGIGELLVWTFYFWKHDVENGYYIKDPDYYIKQCFQKFIYRVNQNFLRIDQSAFTNVSIFDRPYFEDLFGGLEYPDGTFAIDYTEEFIKHEKIFLEVVSETRRKSLFTFPVLTINLLYKDGEFKDPEFARWASDHNCKWADSNFFISNKTGTLSSCCFIGSQLVLIKNNDGNIELKRFDELSEDESYNIYHNGNFSKGKLIKTNNTGLYKITLANSQEIIATGDHIFKTPNGDKKVCELEEIHDSLMSNIHALEDHNYTYTFKEGFFIGSAIFGNSSYFNLYCDEANLCDFKNYFNEDEYINNGISSDISAENKIYMITIKDPKYLELYNEFITKPDKDLTQRIFKSSVFDQCYNFRVGVLTGLMTHVNDNCDHLKNDVIITYDNLEITKYFNQQITALISSLGMYPVLYVNKNEKYRCIEIVKFHSDEIPEQCSDYASLDENDPNIVYTKIAHIEPYLDTDEDYVYCFAMDDVNNPYFTLPNGVVSHNCRLLSDSTKLTGFVNSLGAAGLEIGSVKVSTVNLHAIALESNKDEEKYLQILRDRILLNCKVLSVQRSIIKRNIEKGLLPNYSSGLTNIDRQFSTCGLLGCFETMEEFGYINEDELGNKYYSPKADALADKIFKVIDDVKDNFTKEFSFNVESVPGERAAIILAQKDKLLYGSKYNILSNQWIPLSAKCTFQEKTRVSSLLDNRAGGGSISHYNMNAPFANTDQAWDMLNYIASNGVIYFAFNYRINECSHHHGFIGTDICPECGGPVIDTVQRIVGFLQPRRHYSQPRKEEFDSRKWFEYAQTKME